MPEARRERFINSGRIGRWAHWDRAVTAPSYVRSEERGLGCHVHVCRSHFHGSKSQWHKLSFTTSANESGKMKGKETKRNGKHFSFQHDAKGRGGLWNPMQFVQIWFSLWTCIWRRTLCSSNTLTDMVHDACWDCSKESTRVSDAAKSKWHHSNIIQSSHFLFLKEYFFCVYLKSG